MSGLGVTKLRTSVDGRGGALHPQVLIDSFLRSVSWATEGRHFRFKLYCAYDPDDAVYDDAA